MPDRPRYYLTTAIAYPNNKPGLHTLYEVIGADVIARWHRMKGDDTRFLTGTDEHSVNIAERAAELGKDTRAFVDEMVELFTDAEDALLDRARPVHPDDRPRPPARLPGDGPPGVRQRRRLPRQVRGLVLPERGLQGALRPARDAPTGCAARTTRTSSSSGSPSATGSSACRPTGPAARALRGEPRLGRARVPARTRCSRSCARASRTSRSAARPSTGASRSRSPRTARPPSARTARGTPRRASSTSGSTRSSTTSPAPASRTTRRRSRSGGRPTCT